MLLRTKLVATGVAATLATGAGISALNFEVSQESEKKFRDHGTAIEESAGEMNGVQDIITKLGNKITGLKDNLTTVNNSKNETEAKLAETNTELTESIRAKQDAELERNNANLEVSKANFEIRKANRYVEKLAKTSDEQTTTLNNSKENLKAAMQSAQNYLNDNSEVSTVK